MTTSELEKKGEDWQWEIIKAHSDENNNCIGDWYEDWIPNACSPENAFKAGFLHAIEVLEKKVFLPEFKEKDPNVLAGYINAIRFLKQYASEQPRTEDNVSERSRNKGEHE